MSKLLTPIHPLTLEGRDIRLEPLSLAHVPDLALAAQDENIWRYMLYGVIRNEADMRRWVEDILSRQARLGDVPFTVIHRASGRAIGATRYMDVRGEHCGLEIGGSWLAAAHQRTRANTESKYILLRHAFETLGCIRVQFKTDLRNERSQRALERIGAVKEGIWRNHLILEDGVVRHSVFYSILDSEWPAVKAGLEAKLKD
ncbi:MAG: GNAT family N-acetyltransferase [Chloroflexi bacterium]|nr:GNAT family N-acetyltransferase [Chloroflexota bacterium]